MILNDRIVPDMISAPQGDVVANPDEGLDSVVFQDKAIVSDRSISQEGTSAADVTD